jgi:hypothetical protein
MAHSSHQGTVSYRIGAVLLFAAALAGLLLAIYAYVTPLTGVNGSIGALIVIVATLVLALGALVLPVIRHRCWRNLARILLLLGVIGTFVAALLLHRWGIGAAMALGLVGLVIDMTRPARAAPLPRTAGVT